MSKLYLLQFKSKPYKGHVEFYEKTRLEIYPDPQT